MASELNRLTARRTPVVADPVTTQPVASAPAAPVASPVGSRTPASAVPPVGLAGLAAWWGDDGPEPDDRRTEPLGPATVQRVSAAAAESWLGDQGRPEENGFELLDLGDIVADPLSRFREALEQVLLDEALADGLEVSDGPA